LLIKILDEFNRNDSDKTLNLYDFVFQNEENYNFSEKNEIQLNDQSLDKLNNNKNKNQLIKINLDVCDALNKRDENYQERNEKNNENGNEFKNNKLIIKKKIGNYN